MATAIAIIALILSIISLFKIYSCENARGAMEDIMFRNQQDVYKLRTDIDNKPRKGRPSKSKISGK